MAAGPGASRANREADVVTAIVLIRADVARIPETGAAIAQIPQVTEVYSVTGDFDLVALVRVRAHEELADVIPDTLNRVPGVTHTETHIAFRTYSRHDLEAAFALGYPEAGEQQAQAPWLRSSPRRGAGSPRPTGPAGPARPGVQRRRRPGAGTHERPGQVLGTGHPRGRGQRRARVQHHRVPDRPRLARHHRPGHGRIAGRVAAAQVTPPGPGQPEVRGVEHGLADRAVVHDPDRRGVRRGELVKAVIAVEDQALSSPGRPGLPRGQLPSADRTPPPPGRRAWRGSPPVRGS